MTPETFLSLCLFAFVTSITPGPNNAMLLASGVNFGLRRTVPHLLGVTLGFTFMQLALGLGVGYIFKAVPGLYPTLRALGAAYLLYLAWRIANATPPAAPASAQAQTIGTGRSALETRPMTFMEASVFQWVNPKAIMMCVTAVSTYAPPDQPVAGALLITAVFFFAGMPCVALWAVTGSSLRGFLADRRRLRAFNWAMALALVASMAPLVGDAFQDGLF
jgi:threonine/homoserine/homoserine lactone efflux protein